MPLSAAAIGTPDDNRTDVAIAIITRAGKVLICQRPDGGSFAGYWEFPGGKREPDETVAQCLVREVHEELAIRVTPLHALRTVDHDYPRGRIRLHPYVCDHTDGEPQLLACQAAIWVDPPDLKRYQFPPANDRLIEEAVEYLADFDRSRG
jgi:mutator protein MutT